MIRQNWRCHACMVIKKSYYHIYTSWTFSSLIYIWIKTKDFKKVILDFIFLSTITFAITISCWPHFLDGNYNIIFETLSKSSNWNIDKLYGILNGEFYEIQNGNDSLSKSKRLYIQNFLENKISKKCSKMDSLCQLKF